MSNRRVTLQRYLLRWKAILDALLDGSETSQLIAAMAPEQREAVERLWIFQARRAQLPPEPPEGQADWRTWLFLGGRGAGKTRAGAEWLAAGAEKGARLGLIGPSLHDVREVMIEGPSGLKAIAPKGAMPRYEVSRRRLIWPGGGVAYAHSAEDPDSLRGPQFDGAWADEFCAWPKGEETLALIRMGLRRGSDPRLVVTTTPKPHPALRRLMAEPGVAVTRSPSAENKNNLSPSFLEDLNAIYGGTHLAAQELEGLVVEDMEGALWRAEDLARCRAARPPAFDRMVVAVDPPITARGDNCGLVVAGRLGERAFVLADLSVGGLSPGGWAARAVSAAIEYGAAAIVAEANQGGEMVRSVLAAAGASMPLKLVHARIGKRARAEPVAALYEQGRVFHCGAFPALEEELMSLGSLTLAHSPDRADALVWALTDLMLDGRIAPRIRTL